MLEGVTRTFRYADNSFLKEIVEVEKKRTERDIIEYLRTKTGENLGNDPEKWIKKYGK